MPEVAVYRGPHCPRCRTPFADTWLHTGALTCPQCLGEFEATVFTPVEPKVEAARVVEEAPEEANVCANHARNIAVTSCQRCGLFICSLCEMNVGSGSFCPGCFEKLHSQGALQEAAKRYRDFTLLARSAVIVGLLLTVFSFGLAGIPFGAVAIYYGMKGRAQRRSMGKPMGLTMALMIAGALEVGVGLAVIAYFIRTALN